jgi:protein-S-isoprenylcysteine O-methyltransferase Ste14
MCARDVLWRLTLRLSREYFSIQQRSGKLSRMRRSEQRLVAGAVRARLTPLHQAAHAAGRGDTPVALMMLKGRAWLSLAALAVIMGLLLFVSAGRLTYWHAWVYLLLFFGLSTAITLDLLRHDPALLERRIKVGPTAEPRPLQRRIMLGEFVGFLALLVVPALDYRFGWSDVPLGVVVAGDLLFGVGFAFIGRVYRENTYTSATIEVAEGQRVISTGPYAVVRHPMYASTWLYLVGTPLALGSYWGLVALLGMLPLLVWRLLDEERLLAKELPGYADYQRKVRYRLVPGVW